MRTGRPPFDVADLRCPLVYGWGDSEQFAPAAQYLAASEAHAEIVRVTGAGHNAHRSHPEAFAELVRRGIELAATG